MYYYYLCPNCGEKILEGYGFCPNCGEKVTIINNEIYLQTQYDDVSHLYNSLKKVEKSALVLKKEINDNLNNENFLIELQNNPEEKKELLYNITTSRSQMKEFEDTMNETLNDQGRMNYLENMNNVFGDGKTKIKHTYSLIEEILSLLDIYEEAVTSSNMNTYNNKDENEDEGDEPIPMNDDRILDL